MDIVNFLTQITQNLAGYRTKVAALVVAVLAVNTQFNFIPAEYVQPILLTAGSAGLYFLRDAVAQLEKQLGVSPTPPAPPS
jgi:hypothetical protein